MLGFHKLHPGEIELGVFSDLPKDAWELARLWVGSGKSFVSVARQKNWEPELLGSLLVECLHTAAVSFASSGAMSEEEALKRMWSGIDQERQRLDLQE